MKVLHETAITVEGKEKNLLGEVDCISSDNYSYDSVADLREELYSRVQTQKDQLPLYLLTPVPAASQV